MSDEYEIHDDVWRKDQTGKRFSISTAWAVAKLIWSMEIIHVNGRPYFAETKPQAVKFLKFWSEEIAMDEIRPVPCVRGIERCPSWVPNRLMLPGIEYSKK